MLRRQNRLLYSFIFEVILHFSVLIIFCMLTSYCVILCNTPPRWHHMMPRWRLVMLDAGFTALSRLGVQATCAWTVIEHGCAAKVLVSFHYNQAIRATVIICSCVLTVANIGVLTRLTVVISE